MRLALDADLTPTDRSLAERCAAAHAYGYRDLTITLAPGSPFPTDASTADCARWRAEAEQAGVSIPVVTSSAYWEANFCAADADMRAAALALTRQLIGQAVALGAKYVLVMPGVVGAPARGVGHVRYADALERTLSALEALRDEAESAGVTLAVENAQNRFLLSPVEAADLLAQANSGWIAWSLNLSAILAYADPVDWVATLGSRVAHVQIGAELLEPSALDFVTLAAELACVQFDGVLSFCGSGDPAEARRMLKPLLDTSVNAES